VVEGVLVRMAGSGLDATTIGGLLVIALGSFVYARRLGLVTPSNGVYKFPGAETGLLPDVGFVEAAKVAHIADRRKPVPFAPDLAVEVVSPSQDAGDMAAKARTYLRGGARLVWIVWPRSSHIDVWRPGNLAAPATTLHDCDGGRRWPGLKRPWQGPDLKRSLRAQRGGRPTDGRRAPRLRRPFKVRGLPWSFKARPASQSRGATRVGCAPDVARRIHMGSAASGGDSLRQGL